MSTRLEEVQRFDDAGDVVEFLRQHVNPRMTSKAFAWQFAEIPERPALMVTRDDNGIVCTQSFLPHKLFSDGAIMATTKSEHSFLLPTYRGTPVFTDAYAAGLAASAREGRHICWGFTPAVKVWRDRLGFEVTDDVMTECVARIAPPRLSLSPFPKAFARYGYGLARYVGAALKRGAHGRGTALDVSPTAPDVAALNELFAAVSDASTVRLHMDATFIAWRITKNPNARFHFRSFTAGGRLRGYYVVALDQAGTGSVVHLSDMVFLEHGDGIAMLQHLVREFGTRSGSLLQYFGNSANALNRRTFDLLQERFACDRSLNKDMAFVLKRGDHLPGGVQNWYMNGLWTQGFTR